MTATIFVCIKAHVYLHTRLCMHKTYRKTQQTSIKSLWTKQIITWIFFMATKVP